jgi:hypothetical protein
MSQTSVHVWTQTEQAEVPAAQWLSGRDFTFPLLHLQPDRNASLSIDCAHAAETMFATYTNGVGVRACLAPRAEPKHGRWG